MSFMAQWGRLSRARRDAAYNNTAAVADSAVLNAAREVASSVFRSTNPMHLDLRYGRRERNTWDLFPVGDPDAPWSTNLRWTTSVLTPLMVGGMASLAGTSFFSAT